MGGEGRCAMKALEGEGKGVWVWGTSLLRSQLGSPPPTLSLSLLFLP